MASLNKVQLIGNLGQEPTVRYSPSGDAICNISVATTESWKDKNSGEKVEKTEWHRITFYRQLAEIAGKFLHKGSSVYIEGKLQTRKWADKDGVERYTTEIIADSMQMLGGGPGASGGQSERQAEEPRQAQKQKSAPRSDFSDIDDDIPFLFNMNSFCDTIGSSKQLMRAKYGKGLSIMWANKGNF